MEFTYPRSDNFQRLTSFVTRAFPKGWIDLIQNNVTCNPEISIKDNIMLDDSRSCTSGKCTVAMIKKRLLREELIDPFPFEIKLGINTHEGLNPFIIARKVNHSTNLRIFKFRLLHMDIFTKERMFKFKMSDNDNCDFCGIKETVKHVLWDCSRARGLWNQVNMFLNGIEIDSEIEFENLFVGYNPTNIVLEGIITRFTQVLLRIDREKALSVENIRSELIQFARLNVSVKNDNDINKNIWKKIIGSL